MDPALKDGLLLHLLEQYPPGKEGIIPLKNPLFGIKEYSARSLIEHFNRRGLLTILKLSDKSQFALIELTVEAEDFLAVGGFYYEHEVLKNTIEKLLLEVDRLNRIENSDKERLRDVEINIKRYMAYLTGAAGFASDIKDIMFN